jgi:hypothetical protein
MNAYTIEPLQDILSIYDNKQKALAYYLDDSIVVKLDKSIYFDESNDDLFLNDMIICINKRTLELDYKGRILAISDDKITIRKNKHQVHLVKDDYYIFYKRKKTKDNQVDFYKALLECL